MRNFIIFFEEKEGSTAIVQLLDALNQVSVVRRDTKTVWGWEPFEWFNCGSLSPDTFSECLDLIYRKRPLDLCRLNEIYKKTSRLPLQAFDTSTSVGFKMRITPPWDIPNLTAASPYRQLRFVHYFTKALRRINRRRFRSFMAHKLAELDVVVFIMVRQDIFRWAISKYHGDGTGKPGHLQFRVAKGGHETVDIPRITIDPERFGRIVAKCIRTHGVKRWWANAMRDAGVSVYPLRYEEFLADQIGFFSNLLGRLGIAIDSRELEERLAQGIPLKRVHGSDISEYVANHQEITDRYGDRFISW